MVMAALAWSLKAWIALLVPVSPRWAAAHLEQRRQLLTMDFRTFVAALIHIPCQIIRAARRIRYRVLAWNQLQSTFFRLLDAFSPQPASPAEDELLSDCPYRQHN